MASWKIIEMSLPMILRLARAPMVCRSWPLKCNCRAWMVAESGSSPISAIMVTDLPEPDSPTTASTSPSLSCRLT